MDRRVQKTLDYPRLVWYYGYMETKHCVVCGKEIKRLYKHSQKQWEKIRFCSKKCFGVTLKKKLVKFDCISCGKTTNRKPRSDSKFKFCSKKCAGRFAVSLATKERDFNGKNNPAWKGGVKIALGYKYLLKPLHPHSSKEGYVAEHRLIMEKHIGRIINPEEIVHHVNGDKKDNRIENLMLLKNQSEHMLIHYKNGLKFISHKGEKLSREHKLNISKGLNKHYAGI